MDSLKILPRDVGVFSTTGGLILRTFCFYFFDPQISINTSGSQDIASGESGYCVGSQDMALGSQDLVWASLSPLVGGGRAGAVEGLYL